MFKVGIIGAENYGDYKMFAQKTVHILKNKVKEGILILSIGDNYVNAFAKAANIDVKTFSCDWATYGKNTLKKRNENILSECNAIIIFDDCTKDTKCIYNMAKERNIPLRIIK